MTEFESAQEYIKQCEQAIADSIRNLEVRIRGTGICIEHINISAVYESAPNDTPKHERKFLVLGVDVGTSFMPKIGSKATGS